MIVIVIGNTNCNSEPFTVIFSAGMTNAMLDIPIIDDKKFEDNNNFIFSINYTSLPCGIILGSVPKAEVTLRGSYQST